MHNINTRNNLDVHYPQARVSVYQKVHIIPGSIKQLSHDPKQFQTALKGFLYVQSFYPMDKYFKYSMD
jgi:hypothetical protein